MIDEKKRSRWIYSLLFILSIIAGLLSRSELISLPEFLAEYSGDTIWAMMVFFLFCSIFSRWKTLNLFITAILFSFSIEISQLYHAEWIDQIRRYKIGGLILGFGFKFSDLICYTVGVVIGVAIDIVIIKMFVKKKSG